MRAGNIILLNGTSSSGKTTIAKALQRRMPEPYYLQGLDMLQPGFPPGVFRYRDENDPKPVEGWEIVFEADRLIEVQASPEDCAQQIQNAIEDHHPRTALQELWRAMQEQ